MKFLLAFLLTLFSAHAFADGPVVGYDPDGNPLYLAKDLEDTNPDVLIYRGQRAQPGQLNEVGWIGMCTATLVAPNVVFTASHCATTGTRVTFKHRETGESIGARCTRHPQYNSRTVYNDYELCLLDRAVRDGSQMASFDLERVPRAGDKFVMNGYGQPNLVNLFWGEGQYYRIGGNGNQDLTTCEIADLGSGDSGGSLFWWTDDLTNATHRKIAAVNSRGGGGCSYFNMVSHANAAPWFRAYETANNVQLCGVSRMCDEPPVPVDCDLLYEELGNCYASGLRHGSAMPMESCRAKYERFAQCIMDARR